MYRRDLPHFSDFLRYSLLLLEVEAKQNQTHYFSVGVVFQYSIAIEEIMHWLYSVVNKEMAWFFSPRVHKGTTENKILPFLSQSAHPDYTKRTKKQSTYLEVYDFLSTVWNYYADKYNTVGIRHYLEINILEGHTSKKKKTHYQIQSNRWNLIRNEERLNAVSTEDWYLLSKKQSGYSEQQVATDIWHIEALRDFLILLTYMHNFNSILDTQILNHKD